MYNAIISLLLFLISEKILIQKFFWILFSYEITCILFILKVLQAVQEKFEYFSEDLEHILLTFLFKYKINLRSAYAKSYFKYIFTSFSHSQYCIILQVIFDIICRITLIILLNSVNLFSCFIAIHEITSLSE